MASLMGLGSFRNSEATAGKGGTMAKKSILDQFESGARARLMCGGAGST